MKKKRARSCSSTKAEPIQLPFDSPAFAEAWAMFVRHRKAIRKPLTPDATNLSLGKLQRMGEADAIVAIETTVSNGWLGLFPPASKQAAKHREEKRKREFSEARTPLPEA